LCDDKYTSYQCLNDISCCHKRKTQEQAFFLETHFGLIGAGMLYLGHEISFLYATIVLILELLVTLVFWCRYGFIPKKCACIIIFVLNFCPWVVRLSVISLENQIDGYGNEIYGW
jgi:hypothetical protein